MPVDGVYWSSKLQKKFWFLWKWSATIYVAPDQELKNSGFSFTQFGAENKRDEWLEANGESP